MVDVGAKEISRRTATAQSIVCLPQSVMQHFADGDIRTKKGSVFQAAVIAGIMAAKKTSELIPLCHCLPLDDCKIDIGFNEKSELEITCTTAVSAKTGVEMEALVGASVAALTIYDMCKAMSHEITIRETRLISKKGGKHDFERV